MSPMMFRDPWAAAKALAPAWRPEAMKKAKQRGKVPARWQIAIQREARKRGITLPHDLFDPAIFDTGEGGERGAA